MANVKNKQLESKIQIFLSEIISQDLDNELASQAIVDEVVLGKDHSTANVYVTFMESPIESLTELNRSSSYIRTLLSKKITTRITPKLHFVIDTLLDQINEVDSLIEKANKK